MSDIRELAMRLAEESELGYFSGVWRANEKELVCLVRAAMRGAYARAADISKGLHLNGRVTASGFVHIASADDCEKAIRAEADKLEKK